MIVDVSGPAVPRLSRAAIASFVRDVLRAARARGIAEVSIAFVEVNEGNPLHVFQGLEGFH